jgi:phosphate transport system substrate-binding protein
MATTCGRCTNFDYCTLASQRRVVEVKVGDDFTCPECGSQLKPPLPEENVRTGNMPLIAGLAVLLLAGATFAGYELFSARSPKPQTVAEAQPGAPTPPATPAALAAPATPAATAPQAVAPAPAKPAPPPETILFRMRGSNTIGASLAPKLAQTFLTENGDTNVAIVPQDAPDETKVVGMRNGDREAIVISAHGSATAFTGLGAGDTDIGMASRRVKSAEHDSLAKLGDLTSAAAEHVLALDGIAVIINPANPVSDLTKEQLRDIFSGAVTDWSKVGGTPGPIHVFARDDKSGTYDTFKSLVMDKTKLVAGAKRIEDSRELSTDVAGDTAAIGFVGLPYVADAKPVAIAETGALPLVANRLTVATEDYPLSRRLFLYTPTVNTNRLAQLFVAYALSPQGQAIVEQVGFIPLTIKSETARVPDTASSRYKSLVGGAERLSTDFRFQQNSTALDNRGQRDLDRLVNYMISLHTGGDHLILVGFADNQGSPRANIDVSKKRADAVSALLARRGVRAGHVAAFGSELPVADNASPDGREKNRRVEVYLTQ